LCSFICLFYHQKWAAADLDFMNDQGPQFQLKIKLDSLRVRKLTANCPLWVNYQIYAKMITLTVVIPVYSLDPAVD